MQKLDKRRIKARFRERRSRPHRVAERRCQSSSREDGDTNEQEVSTKTRER